MQINHNITAIRSQNALNKVNTIADKRMRNLSTGLRINTAADDAAGMAIAKKMETQVRGLKRASMNSQDGISLVQTAEGALGEVHSMLQRIRELSVQGANGTLTAEDRRAIQMEVEQLKDEITSTANLTEFNKLKLLDGQMDRRSFTDNEKVSTVAYVSDTVQPGDYALNVSKVGTTAQVEGITSTYTGGMGGKVSVNGEETTISEKDTVEEAFEKLRDLCETVGITLTRDDTWGSVTGGKLHLETQECGSDQRIEILGTSMTLLTNLGLVTETGDVIPEAKGSDAEVKLIYKGAVASDPDYGFDSTATVSANGNRVLITDANYQKIYLDLSLNEEGTALKNGTQLVEKAGIAGVTGVTPTLADSTGGTATGLTYTLTGKTDALNGYVINFEEEAVGSGVIETVVNDTAKTITVTAKGALLKDFPAHEIADSINNKVSTTGVTFTITGATTGLADGDKSAAIAGGVKEVLASDPTNITLGGLEFAFDGMEDAINGCVIKVVEDTAITGQAATRTGDTIIISTENLDTLTAQNVIDVLTDTTTGKFGDTDPEFVGKIKLVSEATDKYNSDLNDTVRIAADDEKEQGKLVTTEKIEFTVLDAGPLQLQVGANEGMKVEIQIPELTATALGLDFINLRTEDGAGNAITLCDLAIAEVSAVRSKLGAYQNRLEYTINNLNTTQENTTAALSRIEDADMAEEMSEYTQKNIISQAGVAMLAQANQRPQQVLQLLQ